jgi:hypothetical protein
LRVRWATEGTMSDASRGNARRVWPLALTSVWLVLLCRCGAARQPAPAAAAPEPLTDTNADAPAASPASRSTMVQSTEQEEAPGRAGAAPAQPPPPPAAAPAAAGPAGLPAADARQSLRMAARADVDRAQLDFDAAMTSCESACRALASMDRATTHLCSFADERDDQRRCDDARQRLAAARGRVRAACGACP